MSLPPRSWVDWVLLSTCESLLRYQTACFHHEFRDKGKRSNQAPNNSHVMKLWTHILFGLVSFVSCVWADKVLLEQRILTDIFAGYDKRVRPYGKNRTGPVVVEVNTYIRSINDLDDVKMLYTVQLTFRQKWLDARLKYNNTHGLEYVTLTSPEKMWIPDLFFSNEMRGHFHKILTPNNLIRIFPDGQVLYSTRVSLDLFCPMDLRNYPMDRQECNIKAASYGYTTNDIVFLWKPEDPVQVVKSLFLPSFTLRGFSTDYCTSKTNTGEYSCIVTYLEFTRSFTFYLVQAFMPTMSLVILSWITFWLHPRSIVTRLGIWIGVLLSMIIVTTSVSESGPRVSYIKAIDVWMGTCIVFIFCVLIEIGLVNNAVTKDDRKSGLRALEEADKTMGMDDSVKNNSSKPTNYSATPLKWLNKYSTQAQRIDAVSRFLFPAAFAFFNFVYWLTYTSK